MYNDTYIYIYIRICIHIYIYIYIYVYIYRDISGYLMTSMYVREGNIMIYCDVCVHDIC